MMLVVSQAERTALRDALERLGSGDARGFRSRLWSQFGCEWVPVLNSLVHAGVVCERAPAECGLTSSGVELLRRLRAEAPIRLGA